MDSAVDLKCVDYAAGLDMLFNLSPDLLCHFSADGLIIKANCAFKDALGYADEDLLGRPFISLVHPDDVPETMEQYHALNRNETVLLFYNRYRCIDGEYKSLSWNATQLPDGTLYASARDISEIIKARRVKERAEERLRLSNERYKLVTAATKDVIWDWNLKNNRLKWGKSFESSFGYTEDIKNGPIDAWADHIHPDDKEYVLKSINAAINSKDVKFWREEYRYLKADNSVAFIIDQGYIIRNLDKKAIRMVGAMQDITELKEKELRIMKQNEQLMEIAQINSHEIRRPVASILGLMQLFDKELIKDSSLSELVKHLKTTTQELDAVIKRIIDKTAD
ncbi:PAS domain-containing protein [Mucilaginibacter jinjuensis]|uniref:histidine kinase n=1 Tax=Mucilaginibacter jinjuensis TaxID=1176721 RepID=A0ABY7T1N3_9SPHI|nr:PAS domain-containing protein [Mucilaginibacter jinjuensis]WCT10153.1 PAS domain-containing protein [Mucilaginibacter jinjuensis]